MSIAALERQLLGIALRGSWNGKRETDRCGRAENEAGEVAVRCPASSLAMASPSKKSLRAAERKRADVARARSDAPVFAPRNLDGNSRTQFPTPFFRTPFFRIENDGPVPRTIFGETPSQKTPDTGLTFRNVDAAKITLPWARQT